jgi:hypothetical protein
MRCSMYQARSCLRCARIPSGPHPHRWRLPARRPLAAGRERRWAWTRPSWTSTSSTYRPPQIPRSGASICQGPSRVRPAPQSLLHLRRASPRPMRICPEPCLAAKTLTTCWSSTFRLLDLRRRAFPQGRGHRPLPRTLGYRCVPRRLAPVSTSASLSSTWPRSLLHGQGQRHLGAAPVPGRPRPPGFLWRAPRNH